MTIHTLSHCRKEDGHVLMAGQSVMYSWDSPSAPRAISWHLLQHRKLKGMKNIVAKVFICTCSHLHVCSGDRHMYMS